MVGGCIIPRRDSHFLQLYAFLQKLILILAEPLLQPHRTPGVRSNSSLRTTAIEYSCFEQQSNMKGRLDYCYAITDTGTNTNQKLAK